jgi:hypothetical protein
MKALERYSPEWIAEATKAPSVLQSWLDHPDDQEAGKAALESLKKLGLVVPISSISHN